MVFPKTRFIALLIVCAMLLLPAPIIDQVHAQSDNEPVRLAVLTFWAFDSEGNVVPRASESDLSKLASVLPNAITARLLQSGSYEVIDESLLNIYDTILDDGEHELERVQQLLSLDMADEVLIGSIAQIQQAVILSARRYTAGDSGPQLVGAAVVRSNNASDAVNSVDNLLTQVFPPESDVVPKPISRIVVTPNVLRIPIGSQAQVHAHAVDDVGRALPTVTMLFNTNDETKVTVDNSGVITGVSPGQAQVNLQPLGRAPAPNMVFPKVDVTVVGPSLGLRAGTSVMAGSDNQFNVGIRLTPSHEIRTTAPTQSLPQAGSNPINVLTSFFGALIGNQMLTVDLDVFPAQDISMTLNAVQRTARNYFGTGIGVAVPMKEGGPSGIILRLTMGMQMPFTFRANMAHPLELNVDFIVGGAQNAPQARIGISTGLDIFQ